VKEGDSITIDAHKLLIQLNVDDAELSKRRAAWSAGAALHQGLLAKYEARVDREPGRDYGRQ
jgi:dihydroxy-acid dehydratase